MKRILVTGGAGSGKSTVARALGEILDLPVIHLDLLYWNPGWVPTPDEEFLRTVADAVTGDAWVCDGNYHVTLPVRLARADTLVLLDLPRSLRTWRILTRHGRPRPDLPVGCIERRMSRDYLAFLKWTWDFSSRARLLAMMQEVRDSKTIVHLRTQAAIDRWLDGLGRARDLRMYLG